MMLSDTPASVRDSASRDLLDLQCRRVTTHCTALALLRYQFLIFIMYSVFCKYLKYDRDRLV